MPCQIESMSNGREMERDLKDYLDQNFPKLATKEEVNSFRTEMKEEISGLRAEMKDMEDRVLHQYHITAEALRDDIKQVAEGVMN